MQEITMSVNKGLITLKLLDKRINKIYIEMNNLIELRPNNSKTEIKDLQERIKGQMNQYQDLIAYRQAIKVAIIKSNAITKVKINNMELTIAEAIYKKESIELDINIKDKLKSDYSKVLRNIVNNDINIENNFKQFITGLFGDSKPTPEELNKHRESFNKTNGYSIVDPLNVKQMIGRMEDDIFNFESEINAILTDSNALTQIIVKW